MDKFVNRYKRLLKWFTQPNYDTIYKYETNVLILSLHILQNKNT